MRQALDTLIEQIVFQKLNEVAQQKNPNIGIGSGSRLPQIDLDPSFKGKDTRGQEIIQKISMRLVGGETPKERIYLDVNFDNN